MQFLDVDMSLIVANLGNLLGVSLYLCLRVCVCRQVLQLGAVAECRFPTNVQCHYFVLASIFEISSKLDRGCRERKWAESCDQLCILATCLRHVESATCVLRKLVPLEVEGPKSRTFSLCKNPADHWMQTFVGKPVITQVERGWLVQLAKKVL